MGAPFVGRTSRSPCSARRQDVHARLSARFFFGQDDLAAAELLAWVAEIHGGLQRKGDGAIEILMKAIEIVLDVSQQQCGWAALLSLSGRSSKRAWCVGGNDGLPPRRCIHAVATGSSCSYSPSRKFRMLGGSGLLKYLYSPLPNK